LLILSITSKAQIANYINNGSFEKIINCITPTIENKAIGWSGVDSSKLSAYLYHSICGKTPHTGVGYQRPKDGGGFMRLQLYCPNCNPDFMRGNIKNRLKRQLVSGKTYCVKMYANVIDSCETAVDALGIYFGDNTIVLLNFILDYH
jgi:hypothetical protein